MSLLTLSLFVLCGLPVADEKGSATDLPPKIFRHWIHSREEDTGNAKVFRPRGYKLPPSRGRVGFELKTDGEFISHEIGPADGPKKVSGRWKAEGKDKIAVSFPKGDRKPYILQIISCDEMMLKIKESSAAADDLPGD